MHKQFLTTVYMRREDYEYIQLSCRAVPSNSIGVQPGRLEHKTTNRMWITKPDSKDIFYVKRRFISSTMEALVQH